MVVGEPGERGGGHGPRRLLPALRARVAQHLDAHERQRTQRAALTDLVELHVTTERGERRSRHETEQIK